MNNISWNKDEIEFLKKCYLIDGLSSSEIYPIFIKKYDRTETSIKIKIKRLKLKHTKEQIQKIKQRLLSGKNNPMFGKASVNKGLTKETSERIKLSSIKISKTRKKMFTDGLLPTHSGMNNPMFGKIPWNNGLTKETNESLRIQGEKISSIRKDDWKNKTEDERKIIVNRLNTAMIQSKNPTKIELKIKNFLDEMKITYIKNYKLNNFLCDFYLPNYNFVIECDGDYWHVNPLFYNNKTLTNPQIRNLERDKRKNIMLNECKISFLRFWEYDINKNFDDVKNKILFTLKI